MPERVGDAAWTSAPTGRARSITRRLVGMAIGWIAVLLSVGGVALNHSLTGVVTANFDNSLDYVLTSLVATTEIDADDQAVPLQEPADPRFFEPNSGLYWQIATPGVEPRISRSLWERTLRTDRTPAATGVVSAYDSVQFAGEPLRIVERDVVLPGSKRSWRFQVAQSRASLDDQLRVIRRTLMLSFAVLGIGLTLLTALQAIYGLLPLRRIRIAIAQMRQGKTARVTEDLPIEVMPMVDELNELLAHTDRQAEEARTHAGNLAHALKTPLTVISNAAQGGAADLAATVLRETQVMRRQIDHHLARARAIGRRGQGHSRARAWDSLESVERAVARLYPSVRIDADGDRGAEVAVERQDLDEMLGNLVENAAKYGGGSVFVTIRRTGGLVDFLIEDDGRGIPEKHRARIFDRGARLDTSKPGTGLGLAIVRDVAEIYGGGIALEESDDLGGLLARLSLPAAA